MDLRVSPVLTFRRFVPKRIRVNVAFHEDGAVGPPRPTLRRQLREHSPTLYKKSAAGGTRFGNESGRRRGTGRGQEFHRRRKRPGRTLLHQTGSTIINA